MAIKLHKYSWVPVLLSSLLQPYIHCTAYHFFMDNIPLLYIPSCDLAFRLWSEKKWIHSAYRLSLNYVSRGKLSVKFLYTYKANQCPQDFPQSPREMESLAPSERVTRIEQKPGSPVNYEVLIMRQAQRQQTPSMAVRCYNVFSGALSVSTPNKCLSPSKTDPCR